MEDEDVDDQAEDSVTVRDDPNPPHPEETLKRSSKVLSESLETPEIDRNDSTPSTDTKDDPPTSDASEDNPENFSIDGKTSKIIFKGFKKRIIAQSRENPIDKVDKTKTTANIRKREKKFLDGKRGKITEYAQYLGLQPASSTPTNDKTNCSRCSNPQTNSCVQSMIKSQQRCICTPAQTAGRSSPGTSELPPISPSPQSSSTTPNNFRITRKVYLCAACGTYFENWNLFLHMREIHKRHICLFCLGMFGQAERLSCHLTKKHNVPEISFTSVEDFYNVFKDSCYLICCTCEKVFSETDNFYNHYCSPLQKNRNVPTTSEICSFCRQIGGSHAVACNNNAETREINSNVNEISEIPGIPGNTSNDRSNLRNERTTKNNRLKRNEETKLTFYQQKLSSIYERKMKIKSRETSSSGDDIGISETSVETGKTTIVETSIVEKSIATTSTTFLKQISENSRDTVTETIMEVSKCTTDLRHDEKIFDEQTESLIVTNTIKNDRTKPDNASPCPASSASPSRSSPSPRRRRSDGSMYDSVAETIMEVSRCSNDSRENTSANDEDEDEDEDERARRKNLSDENRDIRNDDDVSITNVIENSNNDEVSTNTKENYDDRLITPKKERRKSTNCTKNNVDDTKISDTEDDRSSDRSTIESPERLNTTGDNDDVSSPVKQSQTTSVSFSTVNTTDRSLVIKICTNRNSQFSVTSANGTIYNVDRDTSRESEENNNGDDSGSDKRSNDSERASANSCREDDDDDDRSDSDVGKLAVVDDDKIVNVDEKSSNVDETTNNDVYANENKMADDTRNDEKTLNDENSKISKNMIFDETIDDDKMEINEINEKPIEPNDGIVLAPEDCPSIDLNVEGLLETMEIDDLLKRCINAASNICVYCNHARHIAVNGKQLSLHVLAEHRFQPQHPAIIIQREQLIVRIKKSLNEINERYFNLDSFETNRGTYVVQNPRVFECFHCRYRSNVHKDIYLHNRKMHQKTILICIMCKSTFYSYSELLCHLCPGVYSPNVDVNYRCCLCTISNFPSAFRLMVHLRKKHHSCDVCLEFTGNQQRLSNHVWKHKLHHLCYRCGIAYRNKPDITKHLFWKHGTESVLCKKCLQKKWPHVYHFCIPPTAFVCEECTNTFTRAVALKVHKRLHTGDRPYVCDDCGERFISKKLLDKHETCHREPVKIPVIPGTREIAENSEKDEKKTIVSTSTIVASNVAKTEIKNDEIKESKEIVKKVVDVYDLPPLNLSSDSDTDSEVPTATETKPNDVKNDETQIGETKINVVENNSSTLETERSDANDPIFDVELNDEVKKEEAQIMDGIWHNFKSYAASLEKTSVVERNLENEEDKERLKFLCQIILADHDYCVVSNDKSDVEDTKEDGTIDDNCGTMEGEHDYGYKQTKSPLAISPGLNCDSDTNVVATTTTTAPPSTTATTTTTTTTPIKKKKDKSPKKRKQNGGTSSSDSSTDSDSSSCSCGTNCSCTSSSSGSSSSSTSSSDSDSSTSETSPKKSSNRKERRKDKENKETIVDDNNIDEVPKIESSEENMAIVESPPTIVDETPDKHADDVNDSKVEISLPRVPSPQIIFRESDLDTEETETDEDFYDEHPQQLANKLLAEKRNRLMLLAAVAPVATEITTTTSSTLTNNLNNGTFNVDTTKTNYVDPTTATKDCPTKITNSRSQIRKRVKTKKRKKLDKTKITNRVATPTVESIKLNIPKSFYQQKQSLFGKISPALITVLPSRSSTPNFQNSTNVTTSKFVTELNRTTPRTNVCGSVSENDKKRSSKRKRVPKRFYGDSSDEDAEKNSQHLQQNPQIQQQQSLQQITHVQPNLKWRKVDTAPIVPSVTMKNQSTTSVNYSTKNVTLRLSGFDKPLERIVSMNVAAITATESEESESVESSEAEIDNVGEIVETTQELKPEQLQVLQPQQQLQQQQEPPQLQQEHLQPQQHLRSAIETNPTPNERATILNVPPANSSILPTNSIVGGPERSVNLYCYCQCPYDEVSEMIACDGDDCRIEWFHFECVGIMVPPKGKWYCPDCRKKDESLPNNEEYFD